MRHTHDTDEDQIALSAVRSSIRATPEGAIWAAVLTDAVYSARWIVPDDADRRWIASTATTPGSCAWICDVLDLSHERVIKAALTTCHPDMRDITQLDMKLYVLFSHMGTAPFTTLELQAHHDTLSPSQVRTAIQLAVKAGVLIGTEGKNKRYMLCH